METRGVVAEYDAAHRPLHADPGHPGRPRHARPHRQGHPQHPDEQDARHHAGCRRRLRHQGLLPITSIRWRRSRPSGSASRSSGSATAPSTSSPTAHGRDNVAVAEMAMDEDGRFLAMRVDLLANMGAYLSQYAPWIPEGGLTMSTGVYDIPHPLCALPRRLHQHRAGRRLSRRRPAGGGLSRRAAGRSLRPRHRPRPDRDPQAQLHPAGDRCPTRPQGGRIYDTGEFAGHLDRALEVSDWNGLRRRAPRRPSARGKVRGIGLATYVEACAFPGTEAGDDRRSTRTARRRSSSARRPTARATPPPTPSSSPAISVSTTTRSTSSRATPTRSPQRRGDRRLALDPARRGLGRPRGDQARRAGQGARRRRSSKPAPPTSRFADGTVRVAGTDRGDHARRPRRQDAKDQKMLTGDRRLRAAGADLPERHATSPRSRSIPRPA